MDALEYWIWEHATKYGMTKVLQQIKCRYTQTNVPNSWLSALFLRQIKDDWSKGDNKITSKELNTVRQTLVSAYKHFKRPLKHVIETSEFIQLDLYCKAAFLIIRSSGIEPSVKRRAQDELFPMWSNVLWTKTKASFDLKDDLLMDEIMQCHILIRQQLSHHQEKEILVTFGVIVQKHFPSLINFLWKLKLSVLERLQMKKIKLDSSLEFIKPRLSCRLGDELAILNLLEDMQRRKFHLKAVEFLKEKNKLYPARTAKASVDIKLYTLPPNSKSEKGNDKIYPSCFNPEENNQHRFMPTCITLERDEEIQGFVIDRSIPHHSNGRTFGIHWFSDPSSFVLKKEASELTDNERGTTPVSDVKNGNLNTNSNTKPTHAEKEGLVSKNVKVTTTPLEDTNEKIPGPIVKELRVAIPILERDRVQSWINRNQELACPSSSESGSLYCENKKKKFQSSVKTTEKLLTESIDREIFHHGAVTVSEGESCPSSTPTRVEETSDTWENPSDAEGLSSTSASSHRRIETRYICRRLTEQAKLCNKVESCQVSELDESKSFTGSEDSDHPRQLRSRTRKQIRTESPPGVNTRSRKKIRKVSTSSGSYTSASSLENNSPQKSGTKLSTEVAASEIALNPTDLNSRTEAERLSTERNPLNGTPPLEELTSNYQTRDQQEEQLVIQNVQEIKEMSMRRTSIKRKLYEDEEVAKDIPKSKRIPVDQGIDGHRMLPRVLETLKKQSELLRLTKALDHHVDGLETCIARVLSFHEKFHQNLTNDLSASDIAERVKQNSRSAFRQLPPN